LIELAFVGHLALGGRFAHHGAANGRVLRKHGDVGERAPALEHVEILREGLELPPRAGKERLDVHAFDHRKVAKQRLALRRQARRDAEAAVAHHRGGDTERHRRGKRRIPGDLRVVMRVQVDDARHQGEAVGVDAAPRWLVGFADADDAAGANTHRRCDGFRTAAVIEARAAQEHVQHARSLRDNASALQQENKGGTVIRWALVFVALHIAAGAQAAEDRFPRVDADAYVVKRDGRVLWSAAANRRHAPASLTKMMTALLVLERGQLDNPVVVTPAAASQDGSRIGLRAGELLRARDLLAATIMHSANDACRALADAGGPGFVARMNQRAFTLGLRNTHFVDPCGHDRPGQYSTAADLA